jgi:AcrR family transcriptional regulator
MVIYLGVGPWHSYFVGSRAKTKSKGEGRRNGRVTRERILTAAERLFAKRGFDRTSMPDIAKSSGITAGAIYKHFESKDDLFFEVVRRAVEAAAVSSMDLPEAVAAYTSRESTLLRGLAVEIHHASAAHPRVRAMLRHSIDDRIDQLRVAIQEARRQGHAAPDLDGELLANAAMVFILGLMHMETLAPQLIGDATWRDFVKGRMEALLDA